MSDDDELEALFNRKRIEKKGPKNAKKPAAVNARQPEPSKPAAVVPSARTPAPRSKPSQKAVQSGEPVVKGEKAVSSAHVPFAIPKSYHPKKHQPSDLPVGQSVWYRGERFWVISGSPDWSHTCHIRIADSRVRPESGIPQGTISFCVHADAVDIATTTKNPYSRQPSLSEEQRRERVKVTGINDNGDPVAEALRKCGTLDAAYAAASGFLKVDEQELRAKYAKLNPGQQRMNLGNRMRNYLKKNPDSFKELS